MTMKAYLTRIITVPLWLYLLLVLIATIDTVGALVDSIAHHDWLRLSAGIAGIGLGWWLMSMTNRDREAT